MLVFTVRAGMVRWWMLVFTVRDRGGLGGGWWCSLCVTGEG